MQGPVVALAGAQLCGRTCGRTLVVVAWSRQRNFQTCGCLGGRLGLGSLPLPGALRYMQSSADAMAHGKARDTCGGRNPIVGIQSERSSDSCVVVLAVRQ